MKGIKECAAFAYADDRLGEVAALAVSLEKSAAICERDIQFFALNHLADYQMPRKVFFVINCQETRWAN
jgi:acyl-CoA synthetase (AMP-forming)/AMP-acid ligase II